MENLRNTILFPCGYPHYLVCQRGGVNNCRVIHGVIQRLSTVILSYFGITLMIGKLRPVFGSPVLLLQLSDSEAEQWLAYNDPNVSRTHPVDLDGAIVRNAYDWQSASEGVHTVQMLGHSMNAVAIPQGGSVKYAISTSCDSSAVLRVALIPTQPNDDGDLRFSVCVDGAEPQVFSLKEPFRSNQWKQNVLRQQTVRTVQLPNLKAGQHIIVIKAIDPHIILDQLMLDFNNQRDFYLFPL